jgi:hypothetical protein
VVVAAVLAELFVVGGARLLSAVPIDVVPGESEGFSLAQAEHEDQDVGAPSPGRVSLSPIRTTTSYQSSSEGV